MSSCGPTRVDPIDGLIKYVQTVEPYHTKILEATVEYTHTERVSVYVAEKLFFDIEMTEPQCPQTFDCVGSYGIIWDDYDGSTSKSSIIVGQDETFYDDSPPSEGTFFGGTGGYTIGDTITLTDGTVILVDNVSVGGVVTEFTVITSGTLSIAPNTTILQASTSGCGVGFSLTPGLDNLIITTIAAPIYYVVDVDTKRYRLLVEGDQTHLLPGTKIHLYNSAAENNGCYNVYSAYYNDDTGITTIQLIQPIHVKKPVGAPYFGYITLANIGYSQSDYCYPVTQDPLDVHAFIVESLRFAWGTDCDEGFLKLEDAVVGAIDEIAEGAVPTNDGISMLPISLDNGGGLDLQTLDENLDTISALYPYCFNGTFRNGDNCQ